MAEMMIRGVPWRRRVPTLLIAAILHALIIVMFLRGLALAGHARRETPMLVSVVTPASTAAPLAPKLPAVKLQQSPPIPPLVPPAMLLPQVITTAAPAVAASPRPRVRPLVAASSSSAKGEPAPTFISGPLDTDQYYPMEARMAFTQGHVWTRVCVYSTGKVASVALSQSSGDAQLDKAALIIARQTRWAPAIADGKPVARCTPFRVDFSLTSAPLVLGIGGIR
jgi:protein TonB